jgi:hypothetical protein
LIKAYAGLNAIKQKARLGLAADEDSMNWLSCPQSKPAKSYA